MPDLFVAEHFLDEETCRRILSELQAAPDVPAPVYGGRSSAGVEPDVRRVSRISTPERLREDISQRLRVCRKALQEHFAVPLAEHEEPQFLRYRPGDFFVAHQDGNTPLVFDDTRFRRLSVVIFLNGRSNDPEPGSYGGGSLALHEPLPGGGRNALDATPGMLVAFRSETTHEVMPVTHGERYTIVSWYRSSVKFVTARRD